MDYIIQDGELYHHGVLGMKWGVRRFQNKDGSLTQAGKKRISRKQKKALEKARKARHDKAEAAKKAKQEQEDFEKNKKKALESGSAEDVLKYKGKLTNKELQDAFTRINLERQLSDISSKETKSGMDNLDSIMNKVDRMRANTEKGISAYNTLAKIVNSTTNADLPTIDGTSKRDKAAKKAEEAAEKAKKKLIESGSLEEIRKNFGKFTAKELIDINTRFTNEDKINERINNANLDAKIKADIAEGHKKGLAITDKRAADEKRYNDLQEQANARFKAEREARTANRTTSSETYIAGLLGSGNKGSTTVAGLLSAPNQRYIDSGSNYIAGLLPPPRDGD